MKEIAISIGGSHETTEDPDYGTLWADTAEAGLPLAAAETDGFLHTMASTSRNRRIRKTKNQKVKSYRKNRLFPLPT